MTFAANAVASPFDSSHASDRLDRVLGCCVDAVALRSELRARSEVHDAAPAGEVGMARTHEPQGRERPRAPQEVDVGVVDVEQRATACVVVRRVHEDVDRAELRDDGFDRGVDLVA